MRVPSTRTLYRWQRFFAGIVIGTIIGWLLFLTFFGMMQERQVDIISKQQKQIKDLEDKIALFQKDIEDINEKNEKSLLIREIKIEFMNADKLKLNEMEKFELEKNATHYLEQLLLNKKIDIVSKNKELLISSLENKQFFVEKKKYNLKVRQLYLYTTIELYIDVTLS
ncbi:sporulation protein [Pueribacillus theae]|uniref:Sporulation protein n=1 Tax=Pueribacillus theae TaxID=2171751 RepID=A0A2U1K2A9_9BACI|nr:sporulation membrane protein YtrI [Pueribacillus theae]PWA11123.1 sporulation protein [Pueribacillus theae]